MAETPAFEPERICASAELQEKGKAVGFDVLRFGVPARGFALRFAGRVVAYLNRCAHVPTEMDWQPGEFLDAGREFIICSIHGATYEPLDGRCLGGPCAGGRLVPIGVREVEGEVWWQPTADTRSVFGDAPPAGTPHPSER